MRDVRLAKIAAAIYERLLDRNQGRIDELAEAYEEAAEEIRASGLDEDFVYELARLAVDREDAKRLRQGHDAQLDLLSGEETAYDGVWALGDGTRVRVRYAVRDDVERHEQMLEEQLAQQINSRRRGREITAQYIPYMTDRTVTVPQAVTRWREANGK